MKSLILSDDPRVAYNRAPERKRMIHQLDALPLLAQHLKSKFLFILFRVTSALPSHHHGIKLHHHQQTDMIPQNNSITTVVDEKLFRVKNAISPASSSQTKSKVLHTIE
jgi:hypothetical protein